MVAHQNTQDEILAPVQESVSRAVFMENRILWDSGYTRRDEEDGLDEVLGWPGCRLYSREINDWRRRLSCGCGASVEIENWCAQGADASFTAVYDSYEREVRDPVAPPKAPGRARPES